MKNRKLCSLRLVTVIPFLLLLNGCAQNAAYHTLEGNEKNCVVRPENKACLESYYQEYDAFDLAFAEFTERGNAFSDNYQKNVLNRIKKHALDDGGIVLITFIHGWKHNASESDENLLDFKESLRDISSLLRKNFGDDTVLGKRRLVGLYIGWRGASVDFPLIQETTFWDRKAVAEEVGRGGVTQFLLELDQTINRMHPMSGAKDSAVSDNRKNVMVLIGHSFGGAIVLSALNEVLMERAINTTHRGGYARNIGDGVVLLNPAIEANQALNLVEATLLHNNYRPEQRPLLVSLSSDADWATHKAFPLGQTFGLLATWRQTDLSRGYYYDREHPTEVVPLKEEHLDTTTVGNFAPFLTHHLTASKHEGKFKFSFEACKNNPSLCKPIEWTTLSGQPSIRTPENYPLYFIRTDKSIMGGHNDIFNDKVRSFLYAIIDNVISNKLKLRSRLKLAQERDAFLLNQPKEVLEQKMEKYFYQIVSNPR